LSLRILRTNPADRNRRPLRGTSNGVGNAGVSVSRERIWKTAASFFIGHAHDFRDALLFFVGLGGFIHEMLYTDLDRPAVLVTCAGMMGLAGIFRSSGH